MSRAGYSGTPLPGKLGVKPGTRLALIRAPQGFTTTLGALPDGVTVLAGLRAPLDVIVAFFERRRALERRLPALRDALAPTGGLWIAWPKRASGMPTDVTEAAVHELGLAAGLVDNKVCAIDEVWSGLRFVHRVRDRPVRDRPVRDRPVRDRPFGDRPAPPPRAGRPVSADSRRGL